MAYSRFDLFDQAAQVIVKEIDGRTVVTVLDGIDQVVLVGGPRLMAALHDETDPSHRHPSMFDCEGSAMVDHAALDDIRTSQMAQHPAGICGLCEGDACEEGCGRGGRRGCSHAYDGPDSHKVCSRCKGSGRRLATGGPVDPPHPAGGER